MGGKGGDGRRELVRGIRGRGLLSIPPVPHMPLQHWSYDVSLCLAETFLHQWNAWKLFTV